MRLSPHAEVRKTNDKRLVSGITVLSPDIGVSAIDYVNGYDPSTMNSNHWLGSTKLGTDSGLNGGTSVVDVNTKVYGTTNLVCTFSVSSFFVFII